jgi:hypothetical protein
MHAKLSVSETPLEYESAYVQIVDEQGGVIEAEFLIWESDSDNSENIKLRLKYADSFFEAMCAIRLVLEQRKLLLRCYGASRNVYPPPMMLDMGAGWKAYKLYLGTFARQKDVVSIFDVGDDLDPVTVREQKQFYDQWQQSFSNT